MKRLARSILVAACGAALGSALAAGPSGSVPVLGVRVAAESGSADLPEGWEIYLITESKPRTVYRVVELPEGAALEARADKSASGLIRKFHVDLREHPVLEWRWRVLEAPAGADLRLASGDDAPARVQLFFDGDTSSLGLGDRLFLAAARTITGREMPYATISYTWSEQIAVETVVENPHTARERRLVVENGPARPGEWTTFRRNVSEDYRRAFGEEPGELLGVGVFTDADNTGSSARAYYGEIRFRRAD